MKKNLIFAIFLLGIVLVSSFAFAGITGGVITGKLVRGETAVAGDFEVSVVSVSRDGVAGIQITNPETKAVETFAVNSGGTALTPFGEISIGEVKPASLFRRPSVEDIVITPTAEISVVPTSGVASPVAVIATGGTPTGQKCNLNCRWVFDITNLASNESVTLTPAGSAAALCDTKLNEIVTEGSCYSSNPNTVIIPQSYVIPNSNADNGIGYECNFVNKGGTLKDYVIAGALCCVDP